MKATVIFFFFMFYLLPNSSAQNKLAFTFDVAGNQIARTWVCIGCPSARVETSEDRPYMSIQLTKKLSLWVDTDSAKIYFRGQDHDMLLVSRFSLVDRTNKVVLSADDAAHSMDLSTVSKGIYLLRLDCSDGEKQEVGVRIVSMLSKGREGIKH